MAPKYKADPRACLAHIDDHGTCKLTAERGAMKSKPKAAEPKVARPNAEGFIEVESELDERAIRVALARHVHPDDVKRAVKRVMKVNGLRPLRPASQVCKGKSILEMMWEELDAIVERLMGGGAAEEDTGRAQGVAYAIAVIENPYLPDMERIRNEAMDRWESSNA
jgi:hypothetical protein